MSKEALFNVLNNYFDFEGLKILDLFSGTGNISYEFASRGSQNITSVDADFGCIKFIKQTATEFDFNIAAIKSDIFAFIEKCQSSYDIIFADPPYALEQKVFEKIVISILNYIPVFYFVYGHLYIKTARKNSPRGSMLQINPARSGL